MIESYRFANTQAFATWLATHQGQVDGIYIIFDKQKTTSTLTSEEALDLALCYGWIDGVLKRIDDQYYQKYFQRRVKKSIWSNKNNKRVEELTQQGLMQPSGLAAIAVSKAQGRFVKEQDPENFDLDEFIVLIKEHNEQDNEI